MISWSFGLASSRRPSWECDVALDDNGFPAGCTDLGRYFFGRLFGGKVMNIYLIAFCQQAGGFGSEAGTRACNQYFFGHDASI